MDVLYPMHGSTRPRTARLSRGDGLRPVEAERVGEPRVSAALSAEQCRPARRSNATQAPSTGKKLVRPLCRQGPTRYYLFQ